MSIHWQLTPDLDNPEAAAEYVWPVTRTLVDHMRGGFFKVSNLLSFFEYAVGHLLGNPYTMSPAQVLELSQAHSRLIEVSDGLADADVVDYPAPLEEFVVTYEKLRDLEVTFRFAASHNMGLIAA